MVSERTQDRAVASAARGGSVGPQRVSRRSGWRRALPTALLLCSIGGCMDERGEPAGPGGGSGGAVAGTVTRHKTGAGVPNVIAVLVGSSGVVATAHTDAAGRFVMPRVEPGSYALRLTGHDLAGLDTGFEVMEPDSRTVTIGRTNQDVVFTVVGLVPPRITGEIFCSGMPVAGARVRVVGGNADVIVTTNEQGKFGALDLTPGHYTVIPVSSPCTLGPSYQVVRLRAGQSADADFSSSE